MKKIVALLLAIVMMFGLCACNSSSEDVSTTQATEASFVEQTIVNEKDVQFTITSAPYEDGFWGQMIDVHLENNTSTNLMYALENVSVNGYMMEVLFATTVSAGKKENTSITLFSTELENNKIVEITDIEFTLRIYDADNWETPYLIEKTYTVKF